MKEVVEMLFCKGLIKVLLSAETGGRSQFCAVQSKTCAFLAFTPVEKVCLGH